MKKLIAFICILFSIKSLGQSGINFRPIDSTIHAAKIIAPEGIYDYIHLRPIYTVDTPFLNGNFIRNQSTQQSAANSNISGRATSTLL